MFVAVIPAYNEEKTIGSVVRSLLPHVDRIIVVDDASKDQTRQHAKEAGAVVISHLINRGQGAALETGHGYARKIQAAYVLHFDADGQFCAEDVPKAYDAIVDSGADVLLGSRFLDQQSQMPFFKRHVIHPAARLLIDRPVSNIHLTDTHNGFRILSTRALDCLTITQDRMAHATEIPALVRKHNLSYVEFPVRVLYHEFGQGIRSGIRVITDLVIGSCIRK